VALVTALAFMLGTRASRWVWDAGRVSAESRDWQGLVIWEPDTIAAALLGLISGGRAEVSQDRMLELSTAIRERRLAVLHSGGKDGIWRVRLAHPGDPDVPEEFFRPSPVKPGRSWRERWRAPRKG
jgi:hypothetical protein